jgi:hypothetical protein
MPGQKRYSELIKPFSEEDFNKLPRYQKEKAYQAVRKAIGPNKAVTMKLLIKAYQGMA